MYNAVQQQQQKNIDLCLSLSLFSLSPRPDNIYLHNGIDLKRERDLGRRHIIKSTNHPSKKETHIKCDIYRDEPLPMRLRLNLVGFYWYR